MEKQYPKQWLANMTTGETVAAELRLKIINGELTSDDALTENQVAKQFNVSRSPVRDGFKLLKQDQLIRLERMGADVLTFGEAERREVYDLRIMMESFAFARIKDEERAALAKTMRKHLEMMKVAVQFEDAESFTEHDILFHEVLIHATKHRYLLSSWNNIKPILLCLILLSMRDRMQTDPDDFERIHANHEVYAQAVEHNNTTLLRDAFHRNFDDVGDYISALFLEKK
ncbi:GntR family transcriptional regulator [Staphylococcus simulans]|uniref:GntR family transcriptional regulator n=1 Tax=Staphylococcus simulans TaxID=1286 RepID=UPI000E69CB84|nr:GntR family transcriptional regulator [Staphylococcus simulans]RIN67611.1 GntR family transcriptional regulator [Staphylococcus simulans]